MLIFVYGSLLEGYCNHDHFLAGSLKVADATTVENGFRMIDLGHYPGVLPGYGRITGEIYDVNPQTLKRLDRLEGHPNFYRRTGAEFLTTDGRRIEAELYMLQRPYGAEYPAVESGDWRSYRHVNSSNY
jgi:gamma-glutamylaminecyclotransferase